VRASILVLTGANDPLVPADQIGAFENEMRAAKVADWQMVSYGNVSNPALSPWKESWIAPLRSQCSGRKHRAMSQMQAATRDSVVEMKGIGDTINRLAEIASVIAAAVEQQGVASQEIASNRTNPMSWASGEQPRLRLG
jgi:hypothetical protein